MLVLEALGHFACQCLGKKLSFLTECAEFQNLSDRGQSRTLEFSKVSGPGLKKNPVWFTNFWRLCGVNKVAPAPSQTDPDQFKRVF